MHPLEVEGRSLRGGMLKEVLSGAQKRSCGITGELSPDGVEPRPGGDMELEGPTRDTSGR